MSGTDLLVVSGTRTVLCDPRVPTRLGAGAQLLCGGGCGGSCGCGDIDEPALVGRPGRDADHGFDGQVPFYLAPGEVYTVATNRQVLFSYPIEVAAGASLTVDGILVEVS